MIRMATTTETGLPGYSGNPRARRGQTVFNLTEIMNVTGADKYGNMKTVEAQAPLFTLHPQEREALVRANSSLFGITTSRMNRISALEWTVTRKKNKEDYLVEVLKSKRQIFNEYNNPNDINEVVVRRRVFLAIKEALPDVKPDLSNFDASLRRWARGLKDQIHDSAEKIEDWINTINSEDDFEEFQKKWVFDLMTHGSSSIYKQVIKKNLENCYTLPGGSVYPIRSAYVGSATGYVQMVNGYEPKIYFSDEMIFDNYFPVSSTAYGLIPIEALINKIVESQLFDKTAAERADGTKPPEKLVILGNNSRMFGDLSATGFELPVDEGEQKRIETIVNEERKNAVRVLSGIGQPVVADISKADTFQVQSDRQTQLIRDIGFAYNASPFEMSLSGSDFVAGKETSGQQVKQERQKGIYPIVRIIDKTLTRKMIPYKFGSGWLFEHNTGLTEDEQLELENKKMITGTYAVNEVREARGDMPFPEDEYNRPQGAMPMPEQSTGNPLGL